MPLRDEIRPGLVLHLDPDTLDAVGGVYTCTPARRVKDHHFFLCVHVDGDNGRWAPLYTENPTGERVPLSTDGRSGHPKWTDGTWHYHPEQIWTAPHEAIEKAARAGGDRSKPGARNLLDIDRVPQV